MKEISETKMPVTLRVDTQNPNFKYENICRRLEMKREEACLPVEVTMSNGFPTDWSEGARSEEWNVYHMERTSPYCRKILEKIGARFDKDGNLLYCHYHGAVILHLDMWSESFSGENNTLLMSPLIEYAIRQLVRVLSLFKTPLILCHHGDAFTFWRDWWLTCSDIFPRPYEEPFEQYIEDFRVITQSDEGKISDRFRKFVWHASQNIWFNDPEQPQLRKYTDVDDDIKFYTGHLYRIGPTKKGATEVVCVPSFLACASMSAPFDIKRAVGPIQGASAERLMINIPAVKAGDQIEEWTKHVVWCNDANSQDHVYYKMVPVSTARQALRWEKYDHNTEVGELEWAQKDKNAGWNWASDRENICTPLSFNANDKEVGIKGKGRGKSNIKRTIKHTSLSPSSFLHRDSDWVVVAFRNIESFNKTAGPPQFGSVSRNPFPPPVQRKGKGK